jgi:murein L,D-transpeptidase YcbB/YkuD
LRYLVAAGESYRLGAHCPTVPPVRNPNLLNRRQSLGLAAWALLGAGCDAQAPEAQSGGQAPAAAPAPGQPSAQDELPTQIVPPPEFAGLSNPEALRFYQERGWRPAWNAEHAATLKRSLGEARRHGLDRVTFAPKTTPGAPSVRQDIGLTLTALRYANALAFGYVDPRTIEKIFTLERNQVDVAAGLELALAGDGLAEWLASLPPSDDEYKALSAAYHGADCQAAPTRALDQATPAESPPPEKGPPAGASPQNAPAQSAPGAPSGQAAPAQNAPAENAPKPATPNPGAPAASTPPANVPSENTPAAAAPSESANAPEESPPKPARPPADRTRQLAANLERRRWMTRAPPAKRIDVNTAACFLAYIKPGADRWSARVVLGKVGHETPSIQAPFHRVIANPPWRVPMDIARKEIFPKGGGYLRREHMHVVGGQVVQQPGPHNSLGLVKFDVQDPYAIYLHDTPSKSLFAQPDRHKSHGCVRVQNAVDFARLLADQAGQLDAFNKALASGKTSDVGVGGPIAVRLLYHTAYADEGGQLIFAPDVYGWNDKLAMALGLGHAPTNGPGEQPDVDLGP